MKAVRVLFFATLRDLTGVRQVSVELAENANVSDLKQHLQATYPSIKPILPHTLVALNHVYAGDDDLIPLNAEIAVFPPVSGGAVDLLPVLCELTDQPIDVQEWIRRITLPTTGAVNSFTGTVRAITSRGEAHNTLYLEYEAYPDMATAKLRQIAAEMRERWPAIEGIAMVQRIGRQNPGEISVLVACSAAHRDTGVFEAARYGIDRLKEIVPIWKKEVSPTGEHWVEGDYLPHPGE